MKVEHTTSGTYKVQKGRTTVEIFPGQDRPPVPVKIRIDGSETFNTKESLIKIVQNIRDLYTEEQLLEYILTLYNQEI